jgi:hypothetical protein
MEIFAAYDWKPFQSCFSKFPPNFFLNFFQIKKNFIKNYYLQKKSLIKKTSFKNF